MSLVQINTENLPVGSSVLSMIPVKIFEKWRKKHGHAHGT